jgi:hypothetical protein
MPRIEQTPEWKQVSFPELVTTIGGGTSFSVDQLVSMLSAAEQKGEDFRIVHQDLRFVIPLGFIREYFKDHARPTARMSPKEELEYLRKRVSELESERVGADKSNPHPQAPSRLERPPANQVPPPRDETIPNREKMSSDELREDLKKELGAAVPLTRESETVKRRPGRPAAEAKL